jgi:uncharacterized membrane protein YoaK (UPF0700 family)
MFNLLISSSNKHEGFHGKSKLVLISILSFIVFVFGSFLASTFIQDTEDWMILAFHILLFSVLDQSKDEIKDLSSQGFLEDN